MDGLGTGADILDEVEHDYELTDSQITHMEEEDIEADTGVSDSNILADMHGASQVVMEDDLHDEAQTMPEPHNIAQFRDKNITDIARQARIANAKLQEDYTAFEKNNPNMCIEQLRKQVVDMDEAT